MSRSLLTVVLTVALGCSSDPAADPNRPAECTFEGAPLCDDGLGYQLGGGYQDDPYADNSWAGPGTWTDLLQVNAREQMEAFPTGFVKVNAQPIPSLPESNVFGEWTSCTVDEADVWVREDALEAYLSRVPQYEPGTLLVRVNRRHQEDIDDPSRYRELGAMLKGRPGLAPDLNDWIFVAYQRALPLADGTARGTSSDFTANDSCTCVVCHRLDDRQATTDLTFGVPETLQ